MKNSQWLRTPNPTNANNVRNVNTSGALNNNNANNTNGSAADYRKMNLVRTSNESESRTIFARKD